MEKWPWSIFDHFHFLYPPPFPHINMGEGRYIGITSSICPVCVSEFVQTVSPEPPNHFFYQIWYGGVLLWGGVSCRKKWFTLFSAKVTARAYIIKLWLFLLYLLNCWLVCNQTCIISWSVLWKMRLLQLRWKDSKKRLKQWFKMSVNDIFWITEHFVTKFGMLMQHHELECHAEFCCCCYLQGQGHSEGFYDQNMTLSTIFSELLIPWQPNLVWWYIRVSYEKNWITAFRVKVTMKGQNGMFVQMVSSKPPNILFPNLVWWCITMSWSVIQKDWFAIFKVQITARAHDQNVIIFTVSFELLILLLPNLVR